VTPPLDNRAAHRHYPHNMSLPAFVRDNAAVLLLAGAAAGWYAASFAATEALAGTRLALRRRVFAQWLPLITMAIVATLARQTDIALAVLFATSVAALSLVLGIVTVTHEFGRPPTDPGGFPVIEPRRENAARIADSIDAPSAAAAVDRRLWAFVLPAVLIVLLAGFTGRLNGLHAMLLAVEGLVILSIWNTRGEFDEIDAAGSESSPPTRAGPGATRRAVEFALAVVLALLASWAGVRATRDVSREISLVSGGFVAAMLVAPALVLPMIGSGMALARANLYSGAITASVGIVLLNLCFGLPLVIGTWYAKPLWTDRTDRLVAMIEPAEPAPTTVPVSDVNPAAPDPSIRFPIALWRVDTVVLILLGLVLLPLAVGRWLPGKLEGVLLVFVYVIYMGLTTWVARA
jgi:Ca2+/Na+ antiporter